ncbi:3-methyl-2-oxobutanoate hydroxymethyltransferase [uncultured archaeon]|nr:3-methyl-2-oxobutanoate hydroxymethyltransferase [uncultured archaeon]
MHYYFLMKTGKIVMLTAYDYPSASIADRAGVDIILVGDSAANVVHGMKSTAEIGLPEMLVHTRAVARAKPKALIVGDMPAHSYDAPELALSNARKFIGAGAGAVKIEGEKVEVVKALVGNGIMVMGHLGYLPQTDQKPKVRGREDAEVDELVRAAKSLENAGISWLVLELVPELVAKRVTESISAPTIGIGAGRFCSGQVLVFHDLLGLNPDDNFRPKFLKRYANLKENAVEAVKKYCGEVREGKFPGKENSY